MSKMSRVLRRSFVQLGTSGRAASWIKCGFGSASSNPRKKWVLSGI
jgi:hypothetical protein